jgi:phage terminase Nu1 subunit (DNA packaging protein)
MAEATKGTLVNRAGLADIFGVALTTIDTWVRAGCPVVQRGAKGISWTFNTAAVARWREDERAKQAAGDAPDDEDKLLIRKLQAETLTAELKLATARGELAPLQEFERAHAKRMSTVRVNVLNVVSRAALQLLGERDEATFKRKLREELTLALSQAAEADLGLDAEEDSEEDGDAV